MRTAIRVSLVILGLFNCLVNVSNGALLEGGHCMINGLQGVCKKFSECTPAVINKVCHNVAPHDHHVCVFGLEENIVCCPRTARPIVPRDCVDRMASRIGLTSPDLDTAYAVAKSKEMCEEYTGFKTLLRPARRGGREDVSQLLDRAARSLEVRPADSPDVEYEEYVVDIRITNGTLAAASEFPHMAAVGLNNSDTDIRWVCGGTLISDQFVLTAGHCLQDRSSVASWVKLGSTTLDADNPANRYRVSERIAHPDYRLPALYNDIGLLRLDSRVAFDLTVYPACLQTQRVRAGLACTATGWGVTNWENPSMSNDLLKTLIRVRNAAGCNAAFNGLIRSGKKMPQGVREDSTICAGGGANDTCQGDSGSPIQVKLSGSEGMYSVIGVTSFGVKACGTGAPALYTRVSHFVPWIVGIVWPPPPSPPPTTKPPKRVKNLQWGYYE